MKRNLAILLFIIGVLIAGVLIGSPLEVLYPTPHRIITVIAGVSVLTLIVYLYKVAIKFKRKSTKRIALVAVSIVAVPYFLIGLYTFIFVASSYYPMWEDVAIYSNAEGDTIISQFRRTSGSIYDYRYRKVVKDLGNGYRISLDWTENKMRGKWLEYNVSKGTVEAIDFDMEK